MGAGAFVHPLAHVENATLGAGTKVWQYASVTGGTIIGSDCSIWPFAMLDGPVIGDRCKIASHVAMGPGFVIGNDVFIGPSVTLCNDAWPRAEQAGWDAAPLRDGRVVTIRIGDRASLGAGAVILPGVNIGADAMVAAGAVCDRDLPAGRLLRRSGEVVEINPVWARRRMRAA